MFYVYVHRKQTDGTIFYVGKGTGKRQFQKSNRNKYWHNIVNKHGFYSEVVFQSDCEELVLLAEVEQIDQFRKLGLRLCNITDGGDGVSGMRHSDETKKILSEKSKNNNPRFWKDKKFSDEHIENLRFSHLGKKPTLEARINHSKALMLTEKGNKRKVICTATGKQYISISEAARDLNMNRRTLTAMLSGDNPNKTTLIYKEEENASC